MKWFKKAKKKAKKGFKKAKKGLQKTWGNVTPWDTRYEQKQKIKKARSKAKAAKKKPTTFHIRTPEHLRPTSPAAAAGQAAKDIGNTKMPDHTSIKHSALPDVSKQVKTAMNMDPTRNLKDSNNPVSPSDMRRMRARWDQQNQRIDRDLENIRGMDFLVNHRGQDMERYNQGMEGLVNQMEQGPTQDMLDQGMGRFAQLSGMGNNADDYRAAMQGKYNELEGGVNSMEGLSEDYRRMMEKQNALALQQTEDLMSDQLDAIHAGTGSTMQYLKAADEARRQIADQAVAQNLAVAEKDLQMKQYQFEQKKDQYNQMLQAGMINQQQFEEGIRSDRLSALQGYAQLHAQATTERSQDLEAKKAHAQNIYNAINAELGVQQQDINRLKADYELYINPIMDELQIQSGLLGNAGTAYSIGRQRAFDDLALQKGQLDVANQIYNNDIQPILDELNALLMQGTINQGQQAIDIAQIANGNPALTTVLSAAKVLQGSGGRLSTGTPSIPNIPNLPRIQISNAGMR